MDIPVYGWKDGKDLGKAARCSCFGAAFGVTIDAALYLIVYRGATRRARGAPGEC